MPFLFFTNIANLFSKISIRKQLVTVIFCAGFISMQAQFNLKIAYTLDYINHQPLNQIFSDYNAVNPWLDKQLSNLNFSNGVQFGFRYKSNFVALDGHWERMKNSKEISGNSPDGITINKELDILFNRFSLGLEGFNKYFGVGANVNYLLTSVNEDSNDNTVNILKDNTFGNKVYLIFSSTGRNNMSMSIQPYVQIPWNAINYTALNSYLLGNMSNPIGIGRNYHAGISLVFYNGPQDN